MSFGKKGTDSSQRHEEIDPLDPIDPIDPIDPTDPQSSESPLNSALPSGSRYDESDIVSLSSNSLSSVNSFTRNETEIRSYRPSRSRDRNHSTAEESLGRSTNVSVDSYVDAEVFPGALPPPRAQEGENLPSKPLKRPSSTPRQSRAATFTGWFSRRSTVDQPNTTRRLSRQLTQQLGGTGSQPFFANAVLPSVANALNEDLVSIVLDSSDEEEEDDENDEGERKDSTKSSESLGKRSETASLHKSVTQSTVYRLQSIRDQVVDEVKDKLDKVGFFDPRFEKVKVVLQFLKGYFFISALLTGIFSLYWGSMFHRTSRLKNLTVWVVLDDPTVYSGITIDDYFSNTLKLATESSAVYAGWETMYWTDLDLEEKDLRFFLTEKVHHQHIWGAVYVTPNATLDFYNYLQSETPDGINPGKAIEVIYETGRDYVAINSYINKAMEKLQLGFMSLQSQHLSLPLASHLTDSQTLHHLNVLMEPIQFNTTDITPQKLLDPLVAGPQQYGLSYLHLLSLMQFAFFQPYHLKVASTLNDRSFIIYRLVSSQITYLVLGLAYTLVQVFFQIDIYPAYHGKTGFLIFWLVTYLMLSSLGGVNENVNLLFQAIKPSLTPVWMFFWMVVNLAVAYYPLALCPKFYRYGYAMPIKNGYDLYKILLFDANKASNLTRNVLILLAWVALTNIMLPFSMRYYSRVKNEENQEKVKFLKKLKKLKRVHVSDRISLFTKSEPKV